MKVKLKKLLQLRKVSIKQKGTLLKGEDICKEYVQ